MDQQQERIQADLRGMLQGDVLVDAVSLQLYSSDASIFEIRPLGVVRPRGAKDVVATVQYAHEHGIPIHARGAGTGLAGESLGPGLVVDFSTYMRRILEIGDGFARVQPGVVHAELNRQLAPLGQVFGPDPATSQVTTMGSVIAVDASGSYWPRFGSARRHVESLQVVLSDGRLMVVDRQSLSGVSKTDDGRRELVGQLAELVHTQASTIAAAQPRTLVNRCGYHLSGVLDQGHLDLAKVIVGSEGTLALITEATVRTQPLPKFRGVVLLFFDRLDAAAAASLQVPPLGAVACDLMDRRLLSLAREADVRYDTLLPAAAEAMLLVEFHGESVEEVRDSLSATVSRLHHQEHLAFDAATATDKEDVDFYWQLPRRVVPMLYRLAGNERPLPFVEDIAVPPPALPDFVRRVQDTFKTHGVTASLFAHAGHGQLHIRPFLDLGNTQHQKVIVRLAEDLYQSVFDVGGTVSGEHAAGLSRTPFIRRQYGPLYDTFREVKRIFDPHNIFNPGKVVGDDEALLEKHLRRVEAALPAFDEETNGNGPVNQIEEAHDDEPAQDAPSIVVPLLDWTEAELAATARSCNGCGHCRTSSPESRMCPIFRHVPAEEASPRSKGNLMRAVLTGQLPPETLASDEMKAVADLCVNCHQCRLECPANVDIPRLMVEAKGQFVATNGLGLRAWLLSRIERVAAWGSLASPVANRAITNRQSRWLIERLLGIAQGRKLPRFASRSFLRTAQRRRLARPDRRPGHKVLYFVDIYANWFDVQLADALLAVLEHNGARVYVHPQQQPAGMHLVSMGMLDRARRIAEHNVQLLAEAVRQGYTIVTTEPSAALCLTREYPSLLDSDDAELVAANAQEASTYLWRLHQRGKLELDLQPVNAQIGYHLPCHLRRWKLARPGSTCCGWCRGSPFAGLRKVALAWRDSTACSASIIGPVCAADGD